MNAIQRITAARKLVAADEVGAGALLKKLRAVLGSDFTTKEKGDVQKVTWVGDGWEARLSLNKARNQMLFGFHSTSFTPEVSFGASQLSNDANPKLAPDIRRGAQRSLQHYGALMPKGLKKALQQLAKI